MHENFVNGCHYQNYIIIHNTVTIISTHIEMQKPTYLGNR